MLEYEDDEEGEVSVPDDGDVALGRCVPPVAGFPTVFGGCFLPPLPGAPPPPLDPVELRRISSTDGGSDSEAGVSAGSFCKAFWSHRR